jgi:hypothetical protein
MKLDYGSSFHGHTELRSLLLLIISLYMLNTLVSYSFFMICYPDLAFLHYKRVFSRVDSRHSYCSL